MPFFYPPNASQRGFIVPILGGACPRPGGTHAPPPDNFAVRPCPSACEPGGWRLAATLPDPAGQPTDFAHAPRAFKDIAVVGVGVHLKLTGGVCGLVKIVLGAVAPVPLRAKRAEAELVGQPPAPERVERAAKLASEECSPIDDVRGSAWYRRRMVHVATRRALTALIQED